KKRRPAAASPRPRPRAAGATPGNGRMTNAGGRWPPRPRVPADRSCGAPGSTSAHLARTRALALAASAAGARTGRFLLLPALRPVFGLRGLRFLGLRSEEHTSELQSRSDLV